MQLFNARADPCHWWNPVVLVLFLAKPPTASQLRPIMSGRVGWCPPVSTSSVGPLRARLRNVLSWA